MARRLDQIYLGQIKQRNKIENEEKSLIEDLLDTHKKLKDITFKFNICNKQTELLQKNESLEIQVAEKDKELESLRQLQIQQQQSIQQSKKKVYDVEAEYSYIQFSYQEQIQLNQKLTNELKEEKERRQNLAIQMARIQSEAKGSFAVLRIEKLEKEKETVLRKYQEANKEKEQLKNTIQRMSKVAGLSHYSEEMVFPSRDFQRGNTITPNSKGLDDIYQARHTVMDQSMSDALDFVKVDDEEYGEESLAFDQMANAPSTMQIAKAIVSIQDDLVIKSRESSRLTENAMMNDYMNFDSAPDMTVQSKKGINSIERQSRRVQRTQRLDADTLTQIDQLQFTEPPPPTLVKNQSAPDPNHSSPQEFSVKESKSPSITKMQFGQLIRKSVTSAPAKITPPKQLVNSVKKLHSNEVLKLSLTPDHKKMIGFGKDQSITVYDLEVNKFAKIQTENQVIHMIMLPNTNQVCIYDTGLVVKNFDYYTLTFPTKEFTIKGNVRVNHMCAGKSSLALACANGEIKVMIAATMQLKAKLFDETSSSGCICVDFSLDDDKMIACAYENGVLSLWDINEKIIVRQQNLGTVFETLKFVSDQQLICYSKATFYQVDALTMKILMQFKESSIFKQPENVVSALSFSEKCEFLAIGGSQGEISVYNVEMQTVEASLKVDGESPIMCLEWAGVRGLIAGDTNGNAHLFQ